MRILIVEDEASLGEAVSAHLRLQGHATDVVQTLRAAQLAVDVGSFDAILLDLMLPDGEGLVFLTRLRQKSVHTPVIIMTARDQVSDRIKGLSSGADDYLVKPFDLDEMAARLQAVCRRYEGHASAHVQMGDLTIDSLGRRVWVGGADAQLTAKEWAVLEKLMARQGRIVSRDQILEALYGFDEEVGSNTVEVHISHLRKKLGRAHIETLRGQGYRLISGGSP